MIGDEEQQSPQLIVITGATGFVAQQLIPMLQHAGFELLLVSRCPPKQNGQNSGTTWCTYAELPSYPLNDAVFVHTAAKNNHPGGTEEQFYAANVEHLLSIANIAEQGKARCFVNLASTHSLEPAQHDLYGISKWKGAHYLLEKFPKLAINLYLPAVYGSDFQGRLRILNSVPTPLREVALNCLRLAKPMLSVPYLASEIMAIARCADSVVQSWDEWSRNRFLSDPIGDHGAFAIIKRIIDILGAISLLILFWWLMVAIALWIKQDSAGPAAFAQERVGRQGKVFTCYKFRTMQVNTVQAATHEVSGATVTRAGGFLRRTKLDELPQCINILRNEMSFVGPRPCLPVQTRLIDARMVQNVLGVKPGITGLAQIHDVDMSNPTRLAAFDARYRAFRTVLLDIRILIATLFGRGRGDPVGGHNVIKRDSR